MKHACLVFILLTALAAPIGAQTDYTIGPQDVVTVTVFGEPDLSNKYTVEQDGTFTFPLIGRVKAGGLTLRSLERDLKQRLADGYLKNPQVNVSIETYRSQRILVLGEVRSPAEYQLTGDMTLLAALARAGGPTPAASHEAVVVRAPHANADGKPAGEPEIIRIDLVELQAGKMALNIPLIDGDTVTIPKAQSVFVTGQVKTPGAFPVDPGTTVLQVLSVAGGLTERGADSRIKILRTVKGKKVEIKAKLTDVVLPGDTIVVPEKYF
ncbi:MAG TPA: polysaccharide biosynthesis/export family protein [Vicinamibacterales bacterium]|jgi:polysaccharide export outer membrane protein|nr:polysaccharide biosynthesis/export family protein [Vicinamibacterales bacterium]